MHLRVKKRGFVVSKPRKTPSRKPATVSVEQVSVVLGDLREHVTEYQIRTFAKTTSEAIRRLLYAGLRAEGVLLNPK